MAEQRKTKVAEGIYVVHARDCSGGRCKCSAHQATARDRTGTLYRKTFGSKKEADLWRKEQNVAVVKGTAQAPSKVTFDEAADLLLAGMKDGTIKNRSGHVYKPSTVRRYELAIDKHLRPELGKLKLNAIDHVRVKRLIADWERSGMREPSTIRNNLDPLRVIVREAVADGVLSIDPLAKQRLPQGGGRRERVADRTEAQALIDALPANERALWACAFYGTLRRGELRALRWSDVDFEAGAIHVRRGWDDREG
jgi:integrase